MLSWNWKTILAFLAALFFHGQLIGCGVEKQMDTMRAMAEKVTDTMKEGAYGQFQASGQGIEPGIEVGAAIEYKAWARYKGVAGQFSVAGQGQMKSVDDLAPDTKAAYLRIANDTSITNEERANRIMALLRKGQ